MAETLVKLSKVGKAFSGVRVLHDVDFDLRAGEVHILAGENGAGKSTLIKIISGVNSDFDGTMEVFGRPVRFASPIEAGKAGISVIHQEMSLIPQMDVVDNIFLGREMRRPGWRFNRPAQEKRTRALLQRLGLDINCSKPVETYPMPVRQRIEIAKALAFEARVFIMDEPTSAIPESDVALLFDIVRSLRDEGYGIIYISHKMEEIYDIGDRITVLRNGEWVGTAGAGELPERELVRRMVGRELDSRFPPRAATVENQTRLTVEGLSLKDPANERRLLVDNVSFSVKKGEIVGISGLQGSGNSELLNAIFGSYGSLASGTVRVDGVEVSPTLPARSIRHGLSLLTNDRKAAGLIPEASVLKNISLASLRRISARSWVDAKKELEAAQRQSESLRIRMRTLDQPVATLSGGNQQKCLIGRWLETSPKVLLLDEPTRGVDVGAKFEIYDLMNHLTAAGMAIVLITSELPELLSMSDRILVMHRGRISAEFLRDQATQENIVHAAMGANA